jgi:hypothetical protein
MRPVDPIGSMGMFGPGPQGQAALSLVYCTVVGYCSCYSGAAQL